MRFSIITPSFRSARWLPLCVASVSDQATAHEHIVQDALSDDGTQDWLRNDRRTRSFIEADQGMYDAVNRGYRRAHGEFLAYLNCDEQYLPGALDKVVRFFDDHPETEVLFGDVIVVDDRGNYICERRALVPQLLHTWTASNLAFLTAATFIRRRVLDAHQLWFNPNYRDAGDQDWALRLVMSRLQMAVLPEFLSIFTETGNNMNLGENAAKERREFHQAAPAWVRCLAPFALAHFRFRRWYAGHYRCQPHDYAIFTQDSPTKRKNFQVANPTFRWFRAVPRKQRLCAGGLPS
jgi:glycosyltransferase involved in cell wall biosynthesis